VRHVRPSLGSLWLAEECGRAVGRPPDEPGRMPRCGRGSRTGGREGTEAGGDREGTEAGGGRGFA
jgi:hypothetical protein